MSTPTPVLVSGGGLNTGGGQGGTSASVTSLGNTFSSNGGISGGMNSNVSPISPTAAYFYTGGGGGGGSGGHTSIQRLAGNGSRFLNADGTVLLAGGTAGDATGSVNGGTGNDQINLPAWFITMGTGGGGGAGTFVATTAGNGGDGGIPSGGGGGGGGGISAVSDSGAGGAGARGQITVIEYF